MTARIAGRTPITLPVADLPRAIAFCRDHTGLRVTLHD